MGFEKFERGGGRSIGEAVSVNRAGQLTITANFRKYFEGKEHCELFYDKDKRLIGIQGMTSPTKSTRRIRSWTGSDRGTYVSLVGFMNFHGISFKGQRAIYPATWDEDTRMLIVDVSHSDIPVPDDVPMPEVA